MKLINKLSSVGLISSDSQDEMAKKIAITMLPYYISLPASIWALIYLYLDNIDAFLVPLTYLCLSALSMLYLYKTKKFLHFERLQLLMILLLPFVLMWILGGFSNSSFVFIWSFYAPVAAAVYSENAKVEIKWFSTFMLLLLISILIDPSLNENIHSNIPIYLWEIFIFLNIGAGLGGIYFLISYFLSNIKHISMELKRDRESLYNLTNNLKDANKELEHLATCDIVTELPNRLYFQDIVYDLFKRAKNNDKIVAIMFLDLDGFKTINDTLGHEAGDMILKTVGSRLTSIVRASDVVARVGGDEFAIALGDISNVEDVKQVAKTIIKEVNEQCPYKDESCHVGVSIGISFFPEHGDEISQLMSLADEAMYDVKKLGKNNYSIYKQE